MKIAILGFGREGQSLLRFLKKDRIYQGAEVAVLDARADIKTPRGGRARTGREYLASLTNFDIVFRSPGVPYRLPALAAARKKGAVISSATKLFFERCPAKIIGVTGTKGKGTVSTLLYRILKTAKKDVYLAGNIGVPALDILPRIKKTSRVILELSSFQLQDLAASPHIAVVLDIFPDHQDAHASVREYYRAKTAITRHQTNRDIVFFFKKSAQSRAIGKLGKGKKVAVAERDFAAFAPRDLTMKGMHNFKNAVMAATVAAHLGAAKKTIARVITRFPGNEHRLEFVRAVRGISFYNDSASTTPESLAAAIQSFPGVPSVIIAGGKDKGLDYSAVRATLRSKEAKDVRLVALLGENKKKIRRAIAAAGVPIREAATLRSAVRTAYQTAKQCATRALKAANGRTRRAARSPRAAVIFSPGAASFDMFTNYAERGRMFKIEARRIARI